jgi:hypothetical protein
MRVDPNKSAYHEADSATNEFNRIELRRARLLLRRLRFLEAQIRENGGLDNGASSGGAAFAEWEVEALEWVLGPDGIDFLAPVTLPAAANQ